MWFLMRGLCFQQYLPIFCCFWVDFHLYNCFIFYLLFISWALAVYFSTGFLLISFLIPYFFFELFCKTMFSIHVRLKRLISLFSGMDYLWSIFSLICHRHLFIFLVPPSWNMLGSSQPDSFCSIISTWAGISSCLTNNCVEEAERLA